jgi:uncharacterized repeat protein (TIGR01451 family)
MTQIRRLPLLATATTAIVAALTLSAAPAHATPPAPFDAATPTVFVAQGNPTQLENAVENNGQLSFQNVGTPYAGTYNGTAFDTDDDFIYAVSGTFAIVRIDSGGNVSDTGAVAPSNDNSGAWDGATHEIYFGKGNATSMTVFDPTTSGTSTLPLSHQLKSADLTYADGFLWGVSAITGSSDTIERVDPGNGTETQFTEPTTLLPDDSASSAGAAWTYGNGNLGFSVNATGDIYQIAVTDPSSAAPGFTLVSEQPGPASSLNDGASNPGEDTDLALQESAPSTAAAGDSLTYTYTVTNNGPGNSSGYVVTDTLPADLVNPSTSTTGCAIAAHVLTCQGNPLANGATATITVTGSAPTLFNAPLADAPAVTANEADPDSTNDAPPSSSGAIAPDQPDFTISNVAAATPVPGAAVSWTLSGATTGSAGSENQPVTITDALPTGVTLTAAPTGSGWDCSATVLGSSAVTCTATPSTTFAPGTTLAAVTVPTHVDAGARGTLAATAQIGSADGAHSPTATASPVAAPSADTSVTVSAPAGATIGAPATFTVTAANAGPSSATSTTVTVPVPAGAAFSSGPAGCSAALGTVSCVVGTLAPAGSTSLALVFTPSVGGSVELDASISTAEPDPHAADDSASATVQVPAPPAPPLPDPPASTPTTQSADLGVTVTGPTTAPVAGRPIGFVAAVTNHGSVADGGVVVSVPVPSGANVVAMSATCRLVASTVLCVAGSLAPGQSASFVVILGAGPAGPLALSASATGDLPDDVPANNASSTTVTVPAATPSVTADVGVTLTAPAKAVQGKPVTLTVTVTDRSAAGAQDVVVSIPLPPGTTPVRVPTGCVLHGMVVTCSLDSLAAHSTAHFALVVRPRGAGVQGTTATVRTAGSDPTPTNNHAGTTLHILRPVTDHAPAPTVTHHAPAAAVTPPARLVLRTWFVQHHVLSGHHARIALVVRAVRGATARRVTVTDVLARGLTVVSARGAHVHGRRVTFAMRRVGRRARRLVIDVRADPVARTTVLHARASATGARATGMRATGRLAVVPRPAPPFTG